MRQERQQIGSSRIEEPNSTMEQELARFREAATMVGDIVAAEEGRGQRAEMTQQGPPVVPVGARTAYPGYAVEEFPPAYSGQTHELLGDAMGVVADGFRYSPGSTETTLSTTGSSFAGSNANDRLGYTK